MSNANAKGYIPFFFVETSDKAPNKEFLELIGKLDVWREDFTLGTNRLHEDRSGIVREKIKTPAARLC